MEKNITSLPQAWVITGKDYDDNKRILDVAASQEDAVRGGCLLQNSGLR